MKALENKRVLTEINRITTEVTTNYPELSPFLGENPTTLTMDKDPEIDEAALLDYLESLRQLLKNHIHAHKN